MRPVSSDIRTDRQTNKQTNKQTDQHTCQKLKILTSNNTEVNFEDRNTFKGSFLLVFQRGIRI